MIRLLSILLILHTHPNFSQSNEGAGEKQNSIAWNEFYKLQWHDFQGEPVETSMGDAGAVVLIKAKPFLVRKRVEFDVTATFNRKKSWSRDQSEALLAHEQLHFDIAELYARKIRKKIEELRSRGVDDVKIFNTAVQQLLLESNEADQQYDLETLHGAMSRRQAAWVQKIKAELRSLEQHKKQKRIIRAG